MSWAKKIKMQSERSSNQVTSRQQIRVPSKLPITLGHHPRARCTNRQSALGHVAKAQVEVEGTHAGDRLYGALPEGALAQAQAKAWLRPRMSICLGYKRHVLRGQRPPNSRISYGLACTPGQPTCCCTHVPKGNCGGSR